MSPDPHPPPQADDPVPERFRVDLSGRTLLGVYEVTTRLAEGGMGSIYRARDTSLDRPVVVKVPHARFLAEPGFRARLAREIAELVRLEHPHVVRILARGEVDDIPFFVLQYLGGGSLEDRLSKGPHPSPQDTLPWLLAMARTLDFVHRRGSLHRDVKPANILFDQEGHVFLSDFGVAKAVDTEGDALTGTGVGIGSPKYMAPEQALGHAVGPAVDQYGLASTLYEALAGTVPFHGTPVEILVRKSHEDPTPIHEHVPDLPEAAAAALMRAMARDPAERFERCEAFADAFAAGLHSAPARDAPPAPAAPVPAAADAQASRRKRLAGNVLATVLVAVALVTFFLRGREAPPPAPPADRPGATLAEVQLLDAGREPRRLLRYATTPGRRETVALRMDTANEVDIAGMDSVQTNGPAWTLEVDLVHQRVDARGDLHYVGEITHCGLVETAEGLEQFGEVLRGLEGLTVRGRTDDRGVSRRVALDATPEGPGVLRKMLASVHLVLQELATPLPAEAVGAGARWGIARSTEQMGMRMVETSEFELLAMEDGVLTVGVKTALTAPEQAVDFPDAPAGLELTLTSFHGSGTSDIRMDLEHVVPRALTSRVEGRFAAAPDTREVRGSVSGAFRHDLELRRK